MRRVLTSESLSILNLFFSFLEREPKKIVRGMQSVLLLFAFFLLCSIQTYSQTFHVSGNVSTSYTPVSYASVTFINENDTTEKYSAITDTSGNYQIDIVTAVKEETVIPQSIELAPNYPNPFTFETEIPYKLNKESDVSIKIYNILGQEVKTFNVGLQTNGVYG